MSRSKPNSPAALPEQHALVKLVRQAEAGDAAALNELRALADTRLAGLWEDYGNLARSAERSLVNVAAGENALTREAIMRKLETLRAELLGAAPSPLERLLVERVVLCWLQSHYEDAIDAIGLKKGVSWTQSLNQQKRVDGAQRRYLSAIKALATVRRLALPMLQVNFAEKQVNIASVHPGEADG